MEQNKLTKVIQFVDEGVKRRIEKGYYGSDSDWNPQNEISIYTATEIPTLVKKGVKFEQNPSLTEGGFTTFIEIENMKYASIERYAPCFMANKQQVLALVLQKLGIHEYFIKSKFQLDGGIGHKSTKDIHAEANATGYGGANVDSKSSHDMGGDFEFNKVGAEYNNFEGKTPSMEEWKEAKELALKSGIYADVADIIEMRKPGSNTFMCKVVHKRMGGQIDINISMASSLKSLACFSGVGSIGGNIAKTLDFNANIKGYYDTLILYNFNPNEDSVEYKQLVQKELQTVLDDIK